MTSYLQRIFDTVAEALSQQTPLQQSTMMSVARFVRKGRLDALEEVLARIDQRHYASFSHVETLELQVASGKLIHAAVGRLIAEGNEWAASAFALHPHILALMKPEHIQQIAGYVDYYAAPHGISEEYRRTQRITSLPPEDQRLGDVAVAVMESGDDVLKDAFLTGFARIDINRRSRIIFTHPQLQMNDYGLFETLRSEPVRSGTVTALRS